MATKTKQWNAGSGNATINYGGQGDGQITITSDPNSVYEARSMQITVRTTDGSNIQKTITINQTAKPKTDISTAIVTASNQTYSGSAKTPTPTVTLNGTTVPSSGYDVAYSNNTNAGTATITITGKGEYTGTATGTFTIAKASRTLSFNGNYMVLNTSSNGTKTATPSAGSGDGAITYSISSTTYATINSSSGKVTSKTSDGSATVTATIAEGTNYLSATATYTLYVFATTHDYSYNGSYRSVTLPPGTYQFQVWGAQGGSNGTNSSYGITAQAGGKGGYSVGQLTVSQATAIKVYVGGQGSSSAGGYNGGGSTVETSQYNSGGILGYSKMGGGGGATDIRLNDGNLLSRMIVAGGGSGGAMCYKKETTETRLAYYNSYTYESRSENGGKWTSLAGWGSSFIPVSNYVGKKARFTYTGHVLVMDHYPSIGEDYASSYINDYLTPSNKEITIPSGAVYIVFLHAEHNSFNGTLEIYENTSTTSTKSHIGYVGGGESGDGYANGYKGRQNAAGYYASFGDGAGVPDGTVRYVSGAGGGGWYGGGFDRSNSDMNAVSMSGGGSGFVNIAANAGNRPSAYTGLQLDSGNTYAGNTSFVAPGGGNETGHAGNGYARITRLN